ncbi:hypothetical protein [Natranaerobius trueperi]|uniref:hypothetical protein n=1 Tax=Natranaerobius trueperi TaxID=759412 RepID=UPI001303A4EC|nr:hypothetical protein [Natranaerobius trueperi]
MKGLVMLKEIISEDILENGYLVGGTIRDILSSRTPSDIDLAFCKKNHKKVIEVLNNKEITFFPLDVKRGVYQLQLGQDTNSTMVEITLLVDDDIKKDLAKRDFTINAMAVFLKDFFSEGLSDNIIIDPFNGLSALKEKQIIPVSDIIFKKDPIRVLRGFRFQVDGFILSDHFYSLLQKSRIDFSQVSKERIFQEIEGVISKEKDIEKILEFFYKLNDEGVCYKLPIFEDGFNSDFYKIQRSSKEINKLITSKPFKEYFSDISNKDLIMALVFLSTLNLNLHTLKQVYPVSSKFLNFMKQFYRGFHSTHKELTKKELYALELVTIRDEKLLKYFLLGNFVGRIVVGKTSFIQGLRRDLAIFEELTRLYANIKKEYSGDKIMRKVNKSSGPWLKEVLRKVHYYALIREEQEIRKIIDSI